MSQDIQKNINIDPLVNDILQEIEKGKINLSSSIEKEKTFSYWNIGKRIQDYLDSDPDISTYGQFLYSQLSSNLDIGVRSLYLSVQFFKSYPEISNIYDRLSWSHFKILLSVSSPDERKQYENILLSNTMSIRDFAALVRKDKNEIPYSKGNKLTVIKGLPFLYTLKKVNNQLLLDLGFYIYSNNFSDQLTNLINKDVVSASKTDSSYEIKLSDYDQSLLFTYKAYLAGIIDGDTIKVNIDLGFDTFTTQTLRLRGINAFELSTSEGKLARDFVVSKLQSLDFFVIKTYHKDRYSRFLADIFYSKDQTDIVSVLNYGFFLNQELLDNKHAVKYYVY